jgi:hypothetical protein
MIHQESILQNRVAKNNNKKINMKFDIKNNMELGVETEKIRNKKNRKKK